MTVAELVCELMYAGKTRTEIAGYDDAFLRWVLCRPRDEYGKLIRHNPELPRWVTENLDSSGHYRIKPGNVRSYGAMFQQTVEKLNERQQQEAWSKWKESNPSYGVLVDG